MTAPIRPTLGLSCTRLAAGQWVSEGHPRRALTKGLIDGQVSLHNKHGGAGHLGLLEDMAPLPVQDTIDATNHLFWTLSGKERLLATIGQDRIETDGGPGLPT